MTTVYDETLKLIQELSGPVSILIEAASRQVGGHDCGVFAIAIATTLANNKDLPLTNLLMRPHLIKC